MLLVKAAIKKKHWNVFMSTVGQTASLRGRAVAAKSSGTALVALGSDGVPQLLRSTDALPVPLTRITGDMVAAGQELHKHGNIKKVTREWFAEAH